MSRSPQVSQKKLRKHIRQLGDLLGDVLGHQEGHELFELEEAFRQQAKRFRSNKTESLGRLREMAALITNSPQKTLAVLKAFETYFQLVNLAEEQHRVRVLRARSHHYHELNQPLKKSLEEAVLNLRQRHIDAPSLQHMLNELAVIPVFTAHPTESRRRVVLKKIRSMAKALDRLEDKRQFSAERLRTKEWIHELITALWQTCETRSRRPTVADEVDHGLYFFSNIIYQRLPLIYEDLESALREHYPEYSFRLPAFFRYGTWIGGDRDGNPYVNRKVTQDTLTCQHAQILRLYLDEVRILRDHLTMGRSRADFSSALLNSIEDDLALLGEDIAQDAGHYHDEPYRLKLSCIEQRLRASLDCREQWIKDQTGSTNAYPSAAELIHDLWLIQDSLAEYSGSELAAGRLGRLLRRVRIFGFHLASMDIRQHAERHHQAVAELMSAYGHADHYAELSQDDRLSLLIHTLHTGENALTLPQLSDDVEETAGLFDVIQQARGHLGEDAIGSYIISMTTHAVDVLEVLWLAGRAGLFGQLSIAPLFETIDDLKAAPRIMARLFKLPSYRDHLQMFGWHQEIMIGYSDSNKDGGFLMANWSLYQGQQNLAAVCRDADIRWTFFHGRGGSLGRGGGPANRAILAQPPGSVHGRIKLTEQGEVINARYANPDIAQRHLSQLLNAVLISSAQIETENQPRWHALMGELAKLSLNHYRQLVEDDAFIDFFHQHTPIDAISKLNIGSRPSKRKNTEGIGDLRAIPWVFSWAQTRINLPGWYGLGAALATWRQQQGEAGDAELREMYQHWPFFKSTIDNAQLSLYRADMRIAKEYAELQDKPTHQRIFTTIETEFERSRDQVLAITQGDDLLDHMPWFQRSVQLRNPYVDPISFIQVALLKQSQRPDLSAEEQDNIDEALLLSISGIAAGLQNTG